MVLPSTALFGSSFGSMFLKTIGNSNASLLMILVFAFVITANYSNDFSARTQITYSIGYLFMRRPHAASGGASGTSQAGVGGDERAKQSAAAGGAAKDETTPLLGDSEDEDASSSASEANNEETR
ncbi:hypothetical protein HPB48_016596 [Haemaphysalis longicornis]|uniref:Uncharacterized protein n=1 Tax=Haemaphysalis longicornis TaxID=44386 RepID=A0A9J6G5T1_HAELO|nr:hypothetical protein HPB48_016596 [Haemaphysalis longicornis]